MVKFREEIYGRLTALTLAAVRQNKNLKGCLWKKKTKKNHTLQIENDNLGFIETLHKQ